MIHLENKRSSCSSSCKRGTVSISINVVLRRLELKDPWRSLDQNFWSKDIPFGRKTIIYGHNGSGKSTMSELLLSIANGTHTMDVIWEDERGKSSLIHPGSKGPTPGIAVFTRRWVETNLSDFLDGKSASAIVTLGKEAIDARDKEVALEKKITDLREEIDGVSSNLQDATDREKKFVRNVQERVVSQLKIFDPEHFTKNRYSAPKIRKKLATYSSEVPDEHSYTTALTQLGEPAPQSVPELANPPARISNQLSGLQSLLSEIPVQLAIPSLENDATAQKWVEDGIAIHESRDHCLFCDGKLSGERRRELARHFDDSWFNIRRRAESLFAVLKDERDSLEVWFKDLPDSSEIASTFREAYVEAVKGIHKDLEDRLAVIEDLMDVLIKKADNPSVKLQEPDWSMLKLPPKITMLTKVITQHNEQAKRQSEVTEERMNIVLNHLFGSSYGEYRELEREVNTIQKQKQTFENDLELAERDFQEVRKTQFTTMTMAKTLTRDLARVYGKNYLTVEVARDGKSYYCQRGGTPATALSDGEKITLALLYFLRSLEDEQKAVGSPSERIVVIDDPSSSLDREAVFATHQWLIDILKNYGQYIIFTHDFSLLRLFINSQKNRWGKTLSEIRKKNQEEIRFPKVSFLELYATSVSGKRRSRLGRLPTVLLNNTSEYVYLFKMVMDGITDSEDHERLFLLPNAARRVLEVFASYKVPHITNFSQQLEFLMESQEGEAFRDVYDFCNRYSHGEGSESIDVLDARTVSKQIRRSMEFLRSVDGDHYSYLCRACKIDPDPLS